MQMFMTKLATWAAAHRPILAAVMAAIPLSASGCAYDTSEIAEGDEAVGSVQEALVVEPEIYSWYQGQAHTKIPHGSDWTCFLTYMAGNFRGGGERIETYIAADGLWRVGGKSQQSGVGAAASCINRPYRLTKTWSQGQGVVDMGVSGNDNVFCALGMIKGHFAGGGEHVEVYGTTNGNWKLSGGSKQAGVGASAHCSGGSFIWPAYRPTDQGGVAVSNLAPWQSKLLLQPQSFYNCYLMQVKGAWNTSSDYASIAWASNGQVPYWAANAGSGAHTIVARCAG